MGEGGRGGCGSEEQQNQAAKGPFTLPMGSNSVVSSLNLTAICHLCPHLRLSLFALKLDVI